MNEQRAPAAVPLFRRVVRATDGPADRDGFAATVAVRRDDGLGPAFPYAAEGSPARDSCAAMEAPDAAVWLADGPGLPPENSQAVSMRTNSPPPSMKNRRRQ